MPTLTSLQSRLNRCQRSRWHHRLHPISNRTLTNDVPPLIIQHVSWLRILVAISPRANKRQDQWQAGWPKPPNRSCKLPRRRACRSTSAAHAVAASPEFASQSHNASSAPIATSGCSSCPTIPIRLSKTKNARKRNKNNHGHPTNGSNENRRQRQRQRQRRRRRRRRRYRPYRVSSLADRSENRPIAILLINPALINPVPLTNPLIRRL